MTDFPMGDGHPSCPTCKGRGVVDYVRPDYPVPATVTCKCVKTRDIKQNLERGWRGLSKYKAIPKKKAVLHKHLATNLWITAPVGILRQHLRRLGNEQGPRWSFNVFSDADLMDAWLSRVDVDDIYDPDVERIRRTAVSGRFRALVDLVEPPGLLILRVGVKAARNSAMPEVLLEALLHRSMLDKPVWVVDEPLQPLTEGHLSYSYQVGEYINEWAQVSLVGADSPTPVKTKATKATPNGGSRRMTASEALQRKS